jgi:glycosyltransferase involved in cell wall biosynthesis
MIPTKGIEELVAAWSQLELTDWQLDIVGPGDQNYKDTLIGKYHTPSINFLGELGHGEAMTVLSDADCFVLPSYTEGFPNVVLEAMALGKPIIATSVGAIPEMLDGECGLVIKPRSINELKDAIQLLADDPNLRKTMGCRAQEKAQLEYSLEVVFDKYMNIWRQAAERS